MNLYSSLAAHVSRRDLMRFAGASLLTSLSSPWFRAMAADAARQQEKRKSCILLWMDGGPSQAHTFDPKPGGEYKSIATAVPGVEVTEYLPQLAASMKDMVLLRGMKSNEGAHLRAKYHLHTGYNQVSGFEHPALGCIASAEIGQPDSDLPNFVTIDGGFDMLNGGRAYLPAPAYLGQKHSPLMVLDPDKGIENLRTVGDQDLMRSRLNLLNNAEQRFLADHADVSVAAKQAATQRAVRLMQSDRVKAFDLEQEPAAVREKYGKHPFGKGCLLARRLIEAGVPFVEVFRRGWDDHGKAAVKVKERCQWMDPIMATLITDLKERGLLDSTLVVWMGEFGRSPVSAGNHYTQAWTTLLAGGGLQTGGTVGKTNSDGKQPGATVVDRPISVGDLFATICQALGIPYDKELMAPGDRPLRLVEKTGKPIQELF